MTNLQQYQGGGLAAGERQLEPLARDNA